MEQPQVWKLTDLSVPIVKTPTNLSTLFAILYTTPVNGIGLPFLPLASELVSRLEWAKHAIDSLAAMNPQPQHVMQSVNATLVAINQALQDIQAAVRTNPAGAAAAVAQATLSIQAAQAAAQAALVNLNAIIGINQSFLETVQSVANLPATFNDEMAAISQKALTYFCSYFQILYMKTNIVAVPNPIASSVGRMSTYLPALNSSLSLNCSPAFATSDGEYPAMVVDVCYKCERCGRTVPLNRQPNRLQALLLGTQAQRRGHKAQATKHRPQGTNVYCSSNTFFTTQNYTSFVLNLS